MLMESLVVLAVIGVLIAVIIPAIARARGTAQRTACLNNLKNIGLALHNYHSTFNVFPPGYISRDVAPEASATAETGPGWAWGTMLMPQLDQGVLGAMTNFELDPPGISTVVIPFLCPLDSQTPFDAIGASAGPVTLPPASFVGMFGRGSMINSPGAPSVPGMFYRNSRVSMDDVRDGLSQTWMIGERSRTATDPFTEASTARATWYAAIPGSIPVCNDSSMQDVNPAAFVLGTADRDIKGPKSDGIPAFNAVDGFSSQHPLGIHFCRADGSASAVHRDMDGEVFRAMAGRSDGSDR